MPSLNISQETRDTFDHIADEYYPDSHTQDQILADVLTHYIDRQESGVIGRIEDLEEFRDLLGMLDGMRSDLVYLREQAQRWDELRDEIRENGEEIEA